MTELVLKEEVYEIVGAAMGGLLSTWTWLLRTYLSGGTTN